MSLSVIKRILAWLCILAILVGIVGMLAGCDEEPTNPTTTNPTTPTTPTVNTGDKGNYIVTVKTVAGMPMENLTLLVYEDEACTEMRGYGQTDENGQALIVLPTGKDYYVKVNNAPYLVEERYKMTSQKFNIVLNTTIKPGSFAGVSYKIGDVISDFTVTDIHGNTITLSEMLKEKDMVMLNFWATWCGPCVSEFPYMDAAYQNYMDKVGIIAINSLNSTGDMMADSGTDIGIKTFGDKFYEYYDDNPDTNGGLSFPVATEELGLFDAFHADGIPTSVVVDRYGVICMIHQGSLTDESYFNNIFEAFIGENYEQKLYHDMSELKPVVKPNVDMPAVEEIDKVLTGSDLNVTYSPETDPESAEITWPFILGNKDGYDCIYASNAGVSSSFAILYANVTMKAGQALALDYFASSEAGVDSLYVLVDRNDIYQISGTSDDWKTCYPWVALKDGEYEIAFCYIKDNIDNVGDDTVYLKNMRLVDISQVDVASYIPRFCATDLKADGFGYETYITPVFNPNDGFYHVNSENGPLLLANLMMATRFSNDPVYSLVSSYAAENDGKFEIDGVDYYTAIVDYCSFASNSQIYSMCPVNEELMNLLKKVAYQFGIEQTETEWLQMCEYYDAYGTGGVQLADPTVGLNPQSAYEAQMGNNTVTYDRLLMPRGLLFKFVPEKSGAYRITSNCDQKVEGWIFDGEGTRNRTPLYTYQASERMYYSENNISMVYYMEEGKSYYISIAYYDPTVTGTFSFDIAYMSREELVLMACAPGPFTYENEQTYEIVTGGIKVALGEDGYYHELLANGELGSVIYADFTSPTEVIPSHSIMDLLKNGALHFGISEEDEYILDLYKFYEEKNFNGADFQTCLQEEWGESFDAYWESYQVEEVLNGIYHGEHGLSEDDKMILELYKHYASLNFNGGDFASCMKQHWGDAYEENWAKYNVEEVIKPGYQDRSDVIAKYAKEIITSGDNQGCVPVNEELAEVLQMIMDKFLFKDIEDGWIELCYYFDYFGPDANR